MWSISLLTLNHAKCEHGRAYIFITRSKNRAFKIKSNLLMHVPALGKHLKGVIVVKRMIMGFLLKHLFML